MQKLRVIMFPAKRADREQLRNTNNMTSENGHKATTLPQ